MDNDCKVIDWDKPVRHVNSHRHMTSEHRPLSNNRRMFEWQSPEWGKCECIVDAQGHVLWHSRGIAFNGTHFVENIPEEKREWLVFVKDDHGNWDYLRCGIMPWTNSFADEQIRKFREIAERRGGYTDFAKVRYSAKMHGLK